MWSGNEKLTEIEFLTPKEVTSLASAGIETVVDMLDRVPKRYEDRRRFDEFPTQASSVAVCLRGLVVDAGRKFVGARKGVYEVVIQAENKMKFGENSLTCRWFNSPYISKILAVGHEVVLYGKPKDVNGRLIIDHPEFEVIRDGESTRPITHVERIVPIYKNVSGMSQRRFREIMHKLLEGVDGQTLEKNFKVDESYPRVVAYAELHFPIEIENAEPAKRYFALEEFVGLQLEVARRRDKYNEHKGRVLGVDMDLLQVFRNSLPFDLTAGQMRSIIEVIEDMQREAPMNRMLQGDVGSGKTFVAMCAALLAVDSGAQVAVMAPTQILAEQHYLTFRKWLDPMKIRVGLVTADKVEEGPVEWANRREIIIGTHALLYGENLFEDLGLVIIDEQHKFGVEQRNKLVEKGVTPNVLVMTATPIPRTLTLTIYGDLDVSVIDELPGGREKIITGVRPNAKVSDVSKFIRQKLNAGQQAYIVYPLVQESESVKAEAATEEFTKWQSRFKPHQVALVHGKMSPEEKYSVMENFRANNHQVLVATSVIEVGVDVPNASIMVIYDAERFGLSQLHQLRGRIGRGSHKSYCILITKTKNAEALEKLQVLADTLDGFEISEADLKLRGPGDVLGVDQSGLAGMRFIEYFTDMDLICEARAIADSIISVEKTAGMKVEI